MRRPTWNMYAQLNTLRFISISLSRASDTVIQSSKGIHEQMTQLRGLLDDTV